MVIPSCRQRLQDTDIHYSEAFYYRFCSSLTVPYIVYLLCATQPGYSQILPCILELFAYLFQPLSEFFSLLNSLFQLCFFPWKHRFWLDLYTGRSDFQKQKNRMSKNCKTVFQKTKKQKGIILKTDKQECCFSKTDLPHRVHVLPYTQTTHCFLAEQSQTEGIIFVTPYQIFLQLLFAKSTLFANSFPLFSCFRSYIIICKEV